MKTIKYLSILAIAAIFASCSKGDTGATGPQGPQGVAGLNGVANINTSIYTVTVWNNPVANTWTSTYAEPDITDNNNDAIEVYWNTTLGSGWFTLPVTSLIAGGDELTYGFTDNSITFTYYGGSDPSLTISPIYFKVTVIPPAIKAKHPNTNWKNAAEVALLPEVQASLSAAKAQ